MRTDDQIAEGYKTYRGQCKKYCEELMKADSTLRLVRGHIFVSSWPSDPFQPHWWCEKTDGTIVDPTWQQFPFQQQPSKSLYEEFDGKIECCNCGKEGTEETFSYMGSGDYFCCSVACGRAFVGC